MSRKALKLVQKALPELYLCKDRLVLPPTEHILRGFIFERTPYKETFYLWRLVLPLYRYHSRETLDYSERIPGSVHVHLSREAPAQTATDIVRIISEDIPKLQKIRTSRDFLDHVGWMIGNDRPNFLLDLGVTYFLVGRADDAVASLRQAAMQAQALIAYYEPRSKVDDPLIGRMTEIRDVAEHLAQQISVDSAGAAQTISNWERQNIAEFELGPTMANAARAE
jgi:hypothetical protein